MSCSKPLPPFTYELVCFLNRDQLEHFSIVCRSLKNFIERYFHSKPYRVFDELRIHEGSYALVHNDVFWHPTRDDYNAQQFLAGQKINIDHTFYSFAEMRPYLGPTVRITKTWIYVAGDSTYNPDHIAEMESIAYLWRDRDISIRTLLHHKIVAEDFQPILNSPIILQCRTLDMYNADFSFKDYKVLYTVKVIDMAYYEEEEEINLSHWQQFLEETGAKPIIVLLNIGSEYIVNLIDRLKEAFSSAVSLNPFKIVFADADDLTEFRETNKTTNEKLGLKKGLPMEYKAEYLEEYENYTLERSRI